MAARFSVVSWWDGGVSRGPVDAELAVASAGAGGGVSPGRSTLTRTALGGSTKPRCFSVDISTPRYTFNLYRETSAYDSASQGRAARSMDSAIFLASIKSGTRNAFVALLPLLLRLRR